MSLAQPTGLPAAGKSALWVKICGITDAAGLDAALEAGVDAIGFVFAPSVRRMELVPAAALARAARGRCAVVAVLLHPSQSWLDEIVRGFEPDLLQADQGDLERLQLPRGLSTLPVVRSVSGCPPSGRLLYEGARSGSGELAHWGEAQRLARERELILAGGLNSANVATAIQTIRPFGIDVSTGVESAPGRKSPELIREFVQRARAAAGERM